MNVGQVREDHCSAREGEVYRSDGSLDNSIRSDPGKIGQNGDGGPSLCDSIF